MKIVVEITSKSEPEPPVSNIRRVRKWGDPVLIDLLNADTNKLPYEPQSNFQAVQLTTVDANGRAWFGAVSQFQPNIDVEYLRSLQYDGEGYTVKQKMRWLGEGQPSGRPYLQKTSGLAFGTIAFGGQLIEIDPTPYKFKCKYPNREADEKEPPVFHIIKGLRRSDFGKYTHATHPHLIQKATAAYPGNVYVEDPRGVMYHPVWAWEDFPHNERTRQEPLYIAAAFLEP